MTGGHVLYIPKSQGNTQPQLRSGTQTWLENPAKLNGGGSSWEIHIWLVVSTPLKNMKFSWDDDIPNWMENHKIPWFQSPPTSDGFSRRPWDILGISHGCCRSAILRAGHRGIGHVLVVLSKVHGFEMRTLTARRKTNAVGLCGCGDISKGHHLYQGIFHGRMVMRYTGVSWNIMGFNGI